MSIYSQKEFEMLSQTLPEYVSSFSPPAPRGSGRRTEQTRKSVPAGTVNISKGIFRWK